MITLAVFTLFLFIIIFYQEFQIYELTKKLMILDTFSKVQSERIEYLEDEVYRDEIIFTPDNDD